MDDALKEKIYSVLFILLVSLVGICYMTQPSDKSL